MKVLKHEHNEALKQLHEVLKPGDTVYTLLRHVSASRGSRSIDVLVFRGNAPVWLTRHVRQLLAEPFDQKHGGMKVSGCGMDMGFHVVYRLGSCMWPNGTPKPHGTRNGEPDSAGGYALKHQWL